MERPPTYAPDPKRVHPFQHGDGAVDPRCVVCGETSDEAVHVILSELGALNSIASSLERLARFASYLEYHLVICGHGNFATLCGSCAAQR